ncbi:MAG TPA: hypothetical protein VKB69_08525 [Micromonosporaceae bacterium]|nr:hypothetical protein [Micromonosporaceae bacterium]
MPDLDLERIDSAFTGFAASAVTRVVAPGAAAVAATYRHRRRTRAAAAGVVALVLAASTAGYAAWHGHRTTATPTPVDTPMPSPSGPDFEQPPDLPTAACTVSTLPLPPGVDGPTDLDQVVADPTGRYVVASFSKSGAGATIVMWDHGTPSILAVPGADADIVGVSSGGTVVGGGESSTLPGWQFRDGRLTPLATVGDEVASPLAVNGAGDIVGYLHGGYTVSTPVRWPAGQPDVVVPFDGMPNGQAEGVDADGTAVGTGGLDSYVWYANGTDVKLSVPAGYLGGATRIARPWAVGGIGPRTHDSASPAFWNLSTGSITVLPYRFVAFTAVTPDGTAAGVYTWLGGQRAVLYRDGVLSQLPTTPVVADSSVFDAASAMTPDGHTIIGQSNFSVAVWHC